MEAHEGCHKSEDLANTPPPPDEAASPHPKTRINRFFSWSNTHGAGITALSTVCMAIATIALSLITYYYLMATREYVIEARKQRELMQAQFVSANSPNILIESPQDFFHRTENIMGTKIRIQNTGTSVENAEFFSYSSAVKKLKIF